MTWPHFPLPKGKAVGIHSSSLTRSAGDVVKASSAQVFLCLGFKRVRVCRYGGELVFEKAILVYFLCRRRMRSVKGSVQ